MHASYHSQRYRLSNGIIARSEICIHCLRPGCWLRTGLGPAAGGPGAEAPRDNAQKDREADCSNFASTSARKYQKVQLRHTGELDLKPL